MLRLVGDEVCSFCKRSEGEVGPMLDLDFHPDIANTGLRICDQCLGLLDEGSKEKGGEAGPDTPTLAPSEETRRPS